MEVLDLKALAEQAIRTHQTGDLAEAERLYMQILNADPGLFGPRYYLGIMRLQQGRHADAAALLDEALKITPGNLGALMHHGMALQGAGRPAEALASFEKALELQPNLPEALYNRGVALADLQRYELALESYDRALVIQPEMISALMNRGIVLTHVGSLDEALASFDRVLVLQPSNIAAMNSRGLTLRALQRLPEAAAAYERALSLNPGYADARYNLGVVLLDQQRASEALAAFESVMAERSNDAELFNNRGVALWNLKRPAEALASFERTLAIEPQFVEAWGNRGLALDDLARSEEAIASFDMAISLSPRNAVAWKSRADVLRDIKNYDGAIESYTKALEIRPDYAEALINRGYIHWTSWQYEAGKVDVERGLALEPDYPYGRGEVLHTRMYSADWHDFAERKADLEQRVRAGERAVQPFVFQAIAETPEDAQACSRAWARHKYPQLSSAPFSQAERKGHEKIRVGYLSGEFRQQATAILMAGLYERHDRSKFEIIALDNGRNDNSPMRARLEKTFDKWIDIGALSDEEAAARIRAEEIDILVNLNGYFGEARTEVFSRRAAPVQVNYLGFPATLGAPYIDYIIADEVVIPAQDHPFYDEKVVTLPGSYQANDDKGRPMAAIPSRAQAGLPETGFVFCNFNTAYKLTPQTFDGWMRILKQVEGSVLWLLESPAPFADNLRAEAQKRGVTADRLIFAPDLPTDQHLARLSLADLFLDGLPYNAHTTASDALWAGVPLLTQRGGTFPARVAASLLRSAGLPELVTENAADYEALAVKLATDAKSLGKLRDKLKTSRATCALFDTDLFRRRIEAAYTQMWQRWLAGEEPQAFAVTAD